MTTQTLQTPEHGPNALTSKTAQALSLALTLGLLANLAPFPEFQWMPDDPSAFLPKIFRHSIPPIDAPIEGAVDDDELLAMIPGAELAPANDVVLGPAGPGIMSRPMYADNGDPAEMSVSPPSREPDVADDAIPPGMAEAAASWAPEDVGAYTEEDPEVISQFFQSDANLPAPPRLRRTKAGLPLLALEDPQRAMDRFYASLGRTQQKRIGAQTRIVHYGDSLITGDYVTRTLRRLMQTRFGDAGHGFVLAGQPAPWYRRDNLHLKASKGWKINRMTKPTISDGAYGLGAVTFRTTSKGEWVEMTPTGEELGKTVSKMQVFYYAQPRGGKFEMGINGRMVEVDSKTPQAASRKAEIQMNDGPHSFRLKSLGNGEVRLFGMVLERQEPGVVYDSLGLDGARASLLKRMNPDHWHDQIRLRKPDLLIIHYGTNESQAAGLNSQRYSADLSQTVGHLRAALPGVSCLLVAPMDRAEKDDNGRIRTRPVVKRIVLAQRRVAYAQGCAFWNTWAAMGGEGSMAKWYKNKLGGGDLTHPTAAGARRIGSMLFAALMDGYADYAKKRK